MIQIPDRLIKYAVAMILAAAAAGQLPRFNKNIQIETLKLLKSSQSSNWGKVWVPTNQEAKKN